ncbi:hypothetical protein UK23_13255 [Lentzea aerocolonigenes]|uniref:Uncharacterized protein n=1 Tax=Lentzea aerocolonigenes TaxID=68170 RepID=A0A0F0H1U3_LENAE|nr:hypothetical protein [Lentzea aerocolonigenes]KJK49704.1 hypothetical protein UK23_13255 [Lentzea aerocolonigenes]
MHTRWRWILFGLGGAVAASGPIAMAGGPWYGYVFGGLWSLMGGTVAWRSFRMGTKLTSDGITSNSLDRQAAIQWCDVRTIEPKRRRNLIFFHTIAPAVRLHNGTEALTELSLLSIKKDSVPERTANHVRQLERALKAHRATCPTCGAQPKPLATGQGLVARMRARLKSLFGGNSDQSIVR